MLELYEYNLPFRSPFKTGSASYEKRQGCLLHFKDSQIDLVTEASPLPGFSSETRREVKQILLKQSKAIDNFLSVDFTLAEIRELDNHKELSAPSVQYAVSFLALLILAKRQRTSIPGLIGKQNRKSILVNDVISHSSPGEMKEDIENSLEKGFRTIKVKSPHPPDELADLLSNIHREHPDIIFRLDANRSWPALQLEKNCGLFDGIPIQFVEEPIRFENIDDIRQLREQCSLPLALDESISDFTSLEYVLSEYPDIYVIIKPMILGNVLKIHETISRYRSSSNRVGVTTSLESVVGRSMIATVVSLVGDPTMSHGLNTGHLFAHDLLPDFTIEKGILRKFHQKSGYKSFHSIETSCIKKLG